MLQTVSTTRSLYLRRPPPRGLPACTERFPFPDREAPDAMSSLFARNRTFRPTKSHSHGTKRYDLHKHAQATLGK